MTYTSIAFWLFFALLCPLYWRLRHDRQNSLLLVASYVFYASWDARFLFLILLSTLIDFIGGLGVAGVQLPARRLRNSAALLILSSLLLLSNLDAARLGSALLALDGAAISQALPHRARDFALPLLTLLATIAYGLALPRLYNLPTEKRRQSFLILSLTANLAILGFFKYFDFFAASAQKGLGALGFTASSPLLHLILPAGISFYTFQAMSYTIDIYRGEIEPTDNLRDFALFICFFPHLVAGPIMRAHTLLPQVTGPRALPAGAREEGLLLILLGLFKKIVVADNMAPIANAMFWRLTAQGSARGEMPLTGGEVLVGLYAFAFQIYGDFSGYSSIARGLSKWLGYELVLNFRMPYLATTPGEFWTRWHISLSSWLRDYLYIPLGGNRGGARKTYRNLMITMLLGGLWHGASWTFVAWGAYQGLLLCGFRWLGVRELSAQGDLKNRFFWALRVLLMFHFTCLGWLLFRAESFQSVAAALQILVMRPAFPPLALTTLAVIGFYCALLFALEWALDGEKKLLQLTQIAWPARAGVYAYLIFMLISFPAAKAHEFLYFQF